MCNFTCLLLCWLSVLLGPSLASYAVSSFRLKPWHLRDMGDDHERCQEGGMMGLRGCDSRAKQHGVSYACGMNFIDCDGPAIFVGVLKTSS